jgi:hypothetical protein
MKRQLVLLLMLSLTSTVLIADHPSSIDTALSTGGKGTSHSFKNSYVIYRSVGGRTDIKSDKEERKWWCVWLCKRPVPKKAQRIAIANSYYAEVQTGVFAVLQRGPKICNNASSCELKEWAFGLAVELEFPDGGASPTTLGELLEVDGVVTTHEVSIDGQTFTVVTSAGKHPISSGPIL